MQKKPKGYRRDETMDGVELCQGRLGLCLIWFNCSNMGKKKELD